MSSGLITMTPSSNATMVLAQPMTTHFVQVSSFKAIKERESSSSRAVSLSVKARRRNVIVSRGGEGAVLDRPNSLNIDLSQFEGLSTAEEGGDRGRLRYKKGTGSGDSYRVLLLDDVRHTENLVAKVLPQAVPSVTPDDAKRIFNQSRQLGAAVVIVTVKEHAEFYSQMIIRGGLRSSIEPDSDTV